MLFDTASSGEKIGLLKGATKLGKDKITVSEPILS